MTGGRLTTAVEQGQRTNFQAEELTAETATTQCLMRSNRVAPRTTEPEVSRSGVGYSEIWSGTHLIYSFQISEPGYTFRDEYRVTPAECCTIWNLGFKCKSRSCQKWHVCCFESCQTSFYTEHRAIQPTPMPDCAPHAERLVGMNFLFPQALTFDDRSTVADTLEACSRYGIKSPHLTPIVSRSY